MFQKQKFNDISINFFLLLKKKRLPNIRLELLYNLDN